jgi:hypothetical protein
MTKKWMPLNTETIEDINKFFEAVHHNSKIVDVVDIVMVNLSSRGGHENVATGGNSSYQNRAGNS